MPYQARVVTARALKTTVPTSAASSQNAAGSPAALATKPMRAGPTRLPPYPAIVIAATASPAGITRLGARATEQHRHDVRSSEADQAETRSCASKANGAVEDQGEAGDRREAAPEQDRPVADAHR